jgi:hypothetical protein
LNMIAEGDLTGREIPPPLSSVRKEAANTKRRNSSPQKILLDSGSTFVAYC